MLRNLQKDGDVNEKRSLTLPGGVWEGLKLISANIQGSSSLAHGHSTPQNVVLRELGSGRWLHEMTQEHGKITYNLQVCVQICWYVLAQLHKLCIQSSHCYIIINILFLKLA